MKQSATSALHLPRMYKPGIAPAGLWIGAGMACLWAVVIWHFTK
jgi:hypothetical protein